MLSVKKILPAKAFPFIAKAGGVIGLMALLALARSAPPSIDYITNVHSRPFVEIHFGMPQEPTRTYVLQYLNSGPCLTNIGICNTNGLGFTNWSNLATGYSFPFFSNHLVISDSKTNSRFYRLRVTP